MLVMECAKLVESAWRKNMAPGKKQVLFATVEPAVKEKAERLAHYHGYKSLTAVIIAAVEHLYAQETKARPPLENENTELSS